MQQIGHCWLGGIRDDKENAGESTTEPKCNDFTRRPFNAEFIAPFFGATENLLLGTLTLSLVKALVSNQALTSVPQLSSLLIRSVFWSDSVYYTSIINEPIVWIEKDYSAMLYGIHCTFEPSISSVSLINLFPKIDCAIRKKV